MKKELEEATDAQAMVRKELCDNMTPVGLQIIQRVFETTRKNANKQRLYFPEVKEFALRVYRASRCAYKYVQKVFPESLPTASTIRQWMKGSLDNQDPFASAIESVASAQNLLSILQETPEGDDSAVENMEGAEKEVDNSAEKFEGQEEEENLVYYYEAQEEVDSGEQIPLEGNVGNVEMMSHNQSMPVLQVVDQTELANVQVVWTPPQRPANYSLSEDGMSILINVSHDHEF
jgi:hypothetical protein